MLTKSDLKNIGDLIDVKLEQKLQPIKKTLSSIKNTLDMHIRQTDRHLNYHHRRLVQLEEKSDVKPPPFLPGVL